MLGINTPALPGSLRRTNQRTFVSLLLRFGCASRASLAKAAGISQPTAGKITDELLRLGIFEEVEDAPETQTCSGANAKPRLGRPGQLLRLDTARPRFAAVELGVTTTSISVLPVAVRQEDHWAVSFRTPGSPEEWVAALRRAFAPLQTPGLWAILISVPGIVDEIQGKVLFSPNLHWLESVELRDLVYQACGLPVMLIQEIRALALGHLSAEPGDENFFLVDFGQGVGGAVAIRGQLYNHPMPISGEVGHTPVHGNDRRCGCGATGCLETLVSERGLIESLLLNKPAQEVSWEAFKRAVEAKPIEPWLSDSLSAAGRVISGALNVLGLDRVVITGLLTEVPGLADYLSLAIRNGAIWGRFGEVTCQIAPRRRGAGLVASGLDRLIMPAEEEAGLKLPGLAGARQPRRTNRRHTHSYRNENGKQDLTST